MQNTCMKPDVGPDLLKKIDGLCFELLYGAMTDKMRNALNQSLIKKLLMSRTLLVGLH